MTTIGDAIRIVVIFLGFVAMWSLWIARRERGDKWTQKMKDIWLTHIVFVGAAIEGNMELLYRHEFPTAALAAIIFALAWTIRGTFSGSMYTKDQR